MKKHITHYNPLTIALSFISSLLTIKRNILSFVLLFNRSYLFPNFTYHKYDLSIDIYSERPNAVHNWINILYTHAQHNNRRKT